MTWQLLAAGEPRLAAAVPFYGPAPDGADFSGSPNAAVLGIYAELDARVNASQETARGALEAAGLVHEIRVFPGRRSRLLQRHRLRASTRCRGRRRTRRCSTGSPNIWLASAGSVDRGRVSAAGDGGDDRELVDPVRCDVAKPSRSRTLSAPTNRLTCTLVRPSSSRTRRSSAGYSTASASSTDPTVTAIDVGIGDPSAPPTSTATVWTPPTSSRSAVGTRTRTCITDRARCQPTGAARTDTTGGRWSARRRHDSPSSIEP